MKVLSLMAERARLEAAGKTPESLAIQTTAIVAALAPQRHVMLHRRDTVQPVARCVCQKAQGQAPWRNADGDWLAARRTLAEQIRDAFNTAVPDAGVGLLTIGPAPMAPVAPVVDDAPVVDAQPGPLVPEPGPD